MNEFRNRQTSRLAEFILLFNDNKLSLAHLVKNIEAVLALDEMSTLRKELDDSVFSLEEINAHLIEGGKLTDELHEIIQQNIDYITKVVER